MQPEKRKKSTIMIFITLLAIPFTYTPAFGSESSTAATSPANAISLPSIDTSAPSTFETASFGLGWFWGIESRFGIVDGVIRTRVGYAGGKKKAPTYRKIGDHTETVQVDYDPARISFEQLLGIIWESHQPDGRNTSGQYMHVVFYHDEAQKEAALASKAALEQKTGRSVTTRVLPVRSFTLAEDYHQKYLLKQNRVLMREMNRIYPEHRDLVDSTAAARLNGYASGYGTPEQLARELPDLGLSEQGENILTRMVP